MPYSKKIMPPVALSMDKSFFNLLVEVLTVNEKLTLEHEKETATQLKEKLLTYTVPKVDEEKNEIVDIRFFEKEASNMIWQLLINCLHLESKTDYYSQLKKLNKDEN